MSENKSRNFIEEIIEEDIRNNKHQGRIHTRFPPEPNGYLHIGHAKSICLNFGIAKQYNGKTNLRFDDTNPAAEETEYVESIKEDIRWLGFDWEDREYYASDYFQQLYEFAVQLIKAGKAYVDDSSAEEIGKMRGIPTVPGILSPYRDRSIDENLVLFEDMKTGKYKEGEKVLRTKLDMSSPNMHLRDPIIYRILFTPHHRTGTNWCIYPTYDFAHGQSDSIEGITHSICTLEFENHRPLYNWFIENLDIFPSRQIEFARLNLEYTLMSKRKLLQLVNEKIVDGWDDPRMPTISGIRRRGIPSEALREFATAVGIARRENVIEISKFENIVRAQLNKIAIRTMAVLRPLKVVIRNFSSELEWMEIVNNPEDPKSGKRKIPFGKEIYIEADDFMESPSEDFFRLTLGGIVRLKSAYIIQCEEIVKDKNGDIEYLLCSYIENSRSGSDKSGLKPKSVIHWVEVSNCISATVRLYGNMFTVPDPSNYEDIHSILNKESFIEISNAKLELEMKSANKELRYQFMRKGYFFQDKSSTSQNLIFNRTISLKDSFLK
ncbi:MAG: glutamine--tRNA ligase/YqeY domain fusion protein [Saprospiraceae bacterium]|nr:glutamine--tRNA ligase/YqeY domain fusion protein [Saprospiraceae bacterium]